MAIYPGLNGSFITTIEARTRWEMVTPTTVRADVAVGRLDAIIREVGLEMSLQRFGVFERVMAESIKVRTKVEKATENAQRKHLTILMCCIVVHIGHCGNCRHCEIGGASNITVEGNLG
jgi:hypothetical protein